MRLFVGIELEEAVRAAIAALQDRVRAAAPGADVRWVDPANFHLTVTFLGDQPDARLPEIKAICGELAARTPDFRFTVRGASAFPKRGPVLKTLWVGVTGDGAEKWKALVKRAETPFAETLGAPREGGLAPHITLGRVKSISEMESLRAALAAEADTDCGTQAAGRITLIQSFLDPGGAVYKNLRAWPLQQAEDEGA